MAVIRQEPQYLGFFNKLVEYLTIFYFSINDRIKKRRAYLNTLRELNRMSDRDLTDIGFTRSEIKSRALKSIYKIDI